MNKYISWVGRFTQVFKKRTNYWKLKSLLSVCRRINFLIDNTDVVHNMEIIWNSKQFDSERLKLMSQIINEARCNTRWTSLPITSGHSPFSLLIFPTGKRAKGTIKGPRANYFLYLDEHYREFFRGITSANLISRERDGSHLHCPHRDEMFIFSLARLNARHKAKRIVDN